MSFSYGQYVVEFVELFDDDDDLFAAAGARKREFNKLDIFKPVKDEQAEAAS